MAGISPEVKDFLLTKANLDSKAVDLMNDVVDWAGKATSVVGMVSAAVDIFQRLLGPKPDPVLEALMRIEKQLATITEQQVQEIVRRRIDELADMRKTAVGAATSLLALADGAKNRREELVGYQRDLRDNLTRLLTTDNNQIQPSVRMYEILSGSPAPDWLATGNRVKRYRYMPEGGPTRIGTNGMREWSILQGYVGYYSSWGYYQTFSSSRPEDLQQPDTMLPVGIRTDLRAWNGRLSLPLILFTLVVYEGATRAIEPYYRATGYYSSDFLTIESHLRDYLQAWEEALLFTRRMPMHYDAFPGGVWPNGPAAQWGFQSWPVAAADPITGATVAAEGWSVDPPAPQQSLFGISDSTVWHYVTLMKSPEERDTHKHQTDAALDKLKTINGMSDVVRLRDRTGALATAPASSPTLQVQPDDSSSSLRGTLIWERRTTASTFSGMGTTDEPVTYVGVERLYATETGLLTAVQGDPGLKKLANVDLAAESEVTFGYRVAAGSEVVFEVPVRTGPGKPGLYNTDKPGLAGIRALPYSQAPQTMLDWLDSWRTYRYEDGRLYGRHDHKLRRMSVESWATLTAQAFPGGPSSLDLPSRGQLLVQAKLGVESFSPGSAASFKLPFTVTEILRVDAAGRDASTADNPVTFNDGSALWVDCLEVVMPDAFYKEDAKIREAAAEAVRKALAKWLSDKAKTHPTVDEWGFPWPYKDPWVPPARWDPEDWLRPEPAPPGPFPDPTDWLRAVRSGVAAPFVADMSALMGRRLRQEEVEDGLTLLLQDLLLKRGVRIDNGQRFIGGGHA